MEKLWFGDWFILMQLSKNMNPMVFHDLVKDLRDRYFIFRRMQIRNIICQAVYLEFTFRLDHKRAEHLEIMITYPIPIPIPIIIPIPIPM